LIDVKYQNPQSIFFEDSNNLTGYFVQWVNKVPILCRLRANYGSVINDDLIVNNAPANKISDYKGLLAENVLGIWFQPIDAKKDPIAMTTPEASFDASNGYKALLDDWRWIWAPPEDFDNPSTPEDETIWRIVRKENRPKEFSLFMPAYVKVVLVVVDTRTGKKLSGAEIPPKPTINDIVKEAKTFVEGLPESIRKGADIHSIDVTIAHQR
jgi:hypothetical protein